MWLDTSDQTLPLATNRVVHEDAVVWARGLSDTVGRWWPSQLWYGVGASRARGEAYVEQLGTRGEGSLEVLTGFEVCSFEEGLEV